MRPGHDVTVDPTLLQARHTAVSDDGVAASIAWHAASIEVALAAVNGRESGLSDGEARDRLSKYGANVLPAPPRRTVLERFLLQFHNLLIYVLLGSAVITGALGEWVDAAVILGVVLINAVFGFVQEGKAERSLDAIRSIIGPKASVLRAGRRVVVPAPDLAPGDILLLESGDRVTADVRLIKARHLRIDEALLTGESVPVEKAIAAVSSETPLAERTCLAFSGTLVTAGQGQGLVVATGRTTEIGRISTLVSKVETLETPLLRKLDTFAGQLTIAILGLSALVFIFAVLVRGYAWADAFMAVVGMAVAAIPEGLPAVLTITLAIGVQRMAERHAIVRRLPAVEALGSVSVICSDKTGTLTRNEMTVTRAVVAACTYEIGGVGYTPRGGVSVDGREIDPAGTPGLLELGRLAALCNDAALRQTDGHWHVSGDPMEGGLVAFAMKLGHEPHHLAKQYPRLDEIPFDAEHRYMATLNRAHDGRVIACVKGAPERIFDMCSGQWGTDGREPFDRQVWVKRSDDLAAAGLRVLALATMECAKTKRELTFSDFDRHLSLVGIVGLIDPPREEAIAAIAECKTAGIEVKMITGDHPRTASAIARSLGLDHAGVVTGQELDRLSDGELENTVAITGVFARTSPEHKLRLVRALQQDGSVIAMTGDGVNDAPALKQSDIGVAMGRQGTEAAKEAAAMVLADDNFASIVAAVKEGRTVYDNLTKVIAWTLPTSVGLTLIIVLAILFGQPLPVTPLQTLWINMVSAVALGLVLAFEPPEPGIMRRPPRKPDEPILSRFLVWRVVFVSLLFAIAAFAIFAFAKRMGDAEDTARTMVVNTIVVLEIFYLFAVRYIHGTSLTWQGFFGTPAVLIGIGTIILLQLALTYTPAMQALFGTAALGPAEAVLVIASGVGLLIVLEIEKVLGAQLSRKRTENVQTMMK